jgi:hypothetical protein
LFDDWLVFINQHTVSIVRWGKPLVIFQIEKRFFLSLFQLACRWLLLCVEEIFHTAMSLGIDERLVLPRISEELGCSAAYSTPSNGSAQASPFESRFNVFGKPCQCLFAEQVAP